MVITHVEKMFLQRASSFYLEAVHKQQVQFSTIFSAQKILLQTRQVGLNVSLHLVKTDTNTEIHRPAVSRKCY